MSSLFPRGLHEVLNLSPSDHTKAYSPAYTPAEMRKAIALALHSNPWIRRSFQIADEEGYSGEDRYVLLAFHALLEAERQTARLINLSMTKP